MRLPAPLSRLRLGLITLTAILPTVLTGAPLNVSSDTDLPEESVESYDSISVSGGATLTIGGGSDITVSGAVTVSGNSFIVFAGKDIDEKIDDEWQGVGSSISAASINVAAGSAIHADGQGYPSVPLSSYNMGTGPGGYASTTTISGNYSASHGGKGTGNAPASDPIGPVYGLMLQPTSLGSSSLGYLSPMVGGGAFQLTVSGTLTVNGRISADGTVQGSNHSGATGGSVWITTTNLAGSGSIQADASSKGVASTNNGSAGGRVAVYYTDASGFSDLSMITAKSGSDVDESEDGTVWLERLSGGKRHLTVFGRVDFEGYETEQLDSITVESGGLVEIPGGAEFVIMDLLRVKDGGTVLAKSRNNEAVVDGEWQGEGIQLTVPTLTIDTGGVFHADGQGYLTFINDGYNLLGMGPGRSESGAHAGSHGGRGATGQILNPSPVTYGSMLQPTDLGSSSYGYSSKTRGGGAIRLIVSDTITIDGLLSANGLFEGTNTHGATGGSIWITTDTLGGDGSIQANASGKGATSTNRTCGGGRIAVYYSNASGFDDLVKIEAKSGGTDDGSEDGTVFLLDVDNGDGDLTVAGRVAVQQDASVSFESITVLDTGLLEFYGGATVRVNGAVNVASGGGMVFRSKGLAKSFRDEWVGEGGHLFAKTITIPSGGSINADGQGYLEGPGSSLRQWVNGAASHGGLGSGTVEPVYGSDTRPLTPGSGGGAGTIGYTAGGGALRLIASEAIVLNGSISANGVADGTSQSGATGGSIWVSTPSLTGSGSIQANAATSGVVAANNDSGGGRIAIYTTDSIGIPTEGIQAEGSGVAGDGTVVLVDDDSMVWLDDLPGVLHGLRPVSWYAGDLASGHSVRLLARQGSTDTIVLTSTDSIGFGTADVSALAIGLYELHLQVVDAGSSVVRELVTSHSINNDLIWHAGAVDDDEVWAAGAIHVIEEDLHIGEGSSVTVEEGAIVKVWPGVMVTLSLDGAFVTEGSSANPTVVTSWLDDSAGGDTNGDADTSSPAINDWDGFQLDFNSVLAFSSNTAVRYSRQTWQGQLEGTTHLVRGQVHQVTGDVNIARWNKLVIEEGAIVKMGDGVDIIFDKNALLETQGSPARPVVITSILDDSFGGDTNGDGTETSPSAGDWNSIQLTSQSSAFMVSEVTSTVMDTIVLYGGGLSTLGMFKVETGALYVQDSQISDSLFEGISGFGSDVRVENTVITGCDPGIAQYSGGSSIDLINCTFDNNWTALLKHSSGTINVQNSIFSNSRDYGIYQDGGYAKDIAVAHTLFWNPTVTNGDVVSAYGGAQGVFEFTTTSDGNVEKDPLYGTLDPLTGLNLSESSPAIDAADGSIAPGNDKLGRARRDEPSVTDTGIAKDGVVPDMGAFEFYDNAPTEIDIKTLSLSGPEVATTGESINLEWTIENIGVPLQDLVWKNRIYLVAAAGGDSERILVGESITDISGQFNTGDRHTEEVEFMVPVVPEGGYLWVVDVNVGNTPFEGANRGNNAIISENSAAIAIPELTTDELLSGAFGGEQDQFAFKFRASSGMDWLIVLDADGDNGRTRLYANRGYLADPTDASESGLPGEPDSLINLSGPNADTWYIFGVAEKNPDGELPFTIGVSEVGFELMSISPSSGSLPGPVTISLEGTGLRANAEVVLSGASGGELPAVDTVFDSGRLSATFDLDGLTIGSFDVMVRQDGAEDTLEDAFQVEPGNPGRLMARFLMPDAVRTGRLYRAWLEYENVGGTDMVAPVIGIYGVGEVKLGLTRDEEDVALDSLSLAAISDTDTPWILPPGAKGRLSVYFRAISVRSILESTTTTAATSDPMNWSEVGAAVRPDDPPDGWDDVWAMLVEDYGPTAGDYVRFVADAIKKYDEQQGIAGPSMLEPLRYFVHETIGEITSDLTGRVLFAESGTPAAGVVVSFTHTVGEAVGAAVTMLDGSFRTTLPAPGDYDVDVDELVISDDSVRITWDGKGSLHDVDVRVGMGGVMEGTVRLPELLNLPEEDELSVLAVHLESNEVFTAHVSNLGRYRLTGLPGGDFEVSAVAAGYAGDGPKAATVTVETPSAGPNFVIRSGGLISGVVVDSDDDPLEGVSVVTAAGHTVRSAVTDESGTYQLEGLLEGDYALSFGLDGYKQEKVSNVAVVVDEETTLDNVALTPSGTINGLILSGGIPVPGVVVSAESSGDRLFDQVSDEDGLFSFTSAYPATWTITADSIEYEIESDTVTIVDSGTPVAIELNLEESTVLRGEVDRVGTEDPATGVVVILTDESGEVLGDISDLDGGFLFGRLEPGEYTIHFADGSHRQTFTVASGVQPDPITLSIETGTVKGTVQFPGDIEELPVVQLRRDGDVVLTQAVPTAGEFGWDNLIPGDYSIVVTQAELTFAGPFDFEVKANETTEIGEVPSGTVRLMISVVDDGTGDPISGGFVTVSDSLGIERFFDLESDGSVEVGGLVYGAYWLAAISSGGVSEKALISFDSDLTEVVLRTMPTGSIGGSVLDSGGDPFELIQVSAFPEGSDAPATDFWTVGNGDYEVPNLLPGSYTVIFAARFDDAIDTLISPKIATGVTVVANVMTSLDAILDADIVGVSGSVTTSDGGHPVSGSVVLKDLAGRFLARSSLDSDGNYRLPKPDAGTYAVHTEANSYSVDNKEAVVGGSTVVIDLEASWVGGRVLTEEVGVSGASDPWVAADQSAVPEWLKGQQIANNMIDWIQRGMGRPRPKSPGYHRPPVFYTLECPCPEVQAIWKRLIRMQYNADQLWDNWYKQWEGGLIAAISDVGLFGVELGKLAITTSKVLEAADLMSEIGSDIAKFESLAKNGLTVGNLPAEEFKVLLKQMKLAQQQMAALWGNRETAYKGFKASSGLPKLLDKITNPATFSSKAGFLGAMGDVKSVVGDVKGVFDIGINTLGLIDALNGKFPNPDPKKAPFLKKVWAKFGQAMDILGPLQAAAQAVSSAGDAITAYENKEFAYENALKEMSKVYGTMLAALNKCLSEPCCKPPRDCCEEEGKNCDPPPPSPGTKNPPGTSPGVESSDPNDKSTVGVGALGYIAPDSTIVYTIRFENVSTATAPAQLVVITDVLDVDLDWSTLELLEIGFNGTVIEVPQGLSQFEGTAEVESDPYPVDVTFLFDDESGTAQWSMQSIDPVTGDYPEDALAGFLPPNDETGRGEGYVSFLIEPKAGLIEGIGILNSAEIVFDVNDPIVTNETVNTIDSKAPTASVAALSATSGRSFTVSWAGDDAGGAGVAFYDVFVSEDGGDWTLWQNGTEDTSASYEGISGKAYAFYAHATDALGFAKPVVPTAQAQTIAGVSFLVNISNRGGVGTGANIMIPGFVINGTGTKKVLVRAVGPTLGAFGVPDVLENPQMIVFKGQDEVESNDDWGQAADQAGMEAARAQVGAFALESESADAALLLDLDPGSYTVQVSGVAEATGVSLVELYDADTAANPSAKLVNISNRGEVGTDASIMIPGFVVGGEAPKTVLIRGVGPTLGVFGVPGVLEDPQLAVFAAGADTPFITNDDWSQAADQTEMEAARLQVGAFALEAGSADAAVLVTLDPGVYTVQVSGVGDTEGVALVEIYEVE